MLHVLVTGGGGYLGTVLVRRLLDHPRYLSQVTVLDRFSWGMQPLASVLRPSHLQRIRILAGDIRDRRALAVAVQGVDAIVHLAGIVGYPACDADPVDADTTNVEGTRNVVEAAGSRRVIFASTGSTYGAVEQVCTEATPINPLTRYGWNKAEAERIVTDHGGVALRLATLYGLSPRMRWDLLVHTLCQQAVQGAIGLYEGHARRTFLHVEDAADLFVEALLDRLGPGVWNAGTDGGNRTKRDLAELLSVLTGCTIADEAGRDADRRDYAVDYEKLRQTGWRPAWTLEGTLPLLLDVTRGWR